MRMLRKILPAALLLSLLLAGCSSTDGESTVTDASATDTEAAVTTEDPYEKDSLPEDLDFGGQTVRIGVYNGHEKVVSPLEETGDILNDAIYQRNVRVKDRLNVEIELLTVNCEWPEYREKVLNAITANTGEYDAWYLWQYDFANSIVDNYWMDLQDAPYIDYSKPWWATSYMEEMSVDGQSKYFLLGDISYGFFNNADCVFFNKNLLSRFDIDPESIYQTVLDGEWTLAKLREIALNVYTDVNGNGVVDVGDTVALGFIGGNCAVPEHFVFAAGNRFSYRGEDGYPVIDPVNDRIIDTIDKVIDLFHNLPTVVCYGKEDSGEANDLWRGDFAQGNSAFHFEQIGYMSYWRDMEDDYGVIPFPKYDEAQETYLSLIHNVAFMYGIPTDCQNIDVTCALMEALASDSHRNVMPVYYEQVLKDKYARDSLSGQVIDIIHDNPVADFAYIMGFGIHGEIRYMCNSYAKNTFASAYKKMEKKVAKQLEKLIEAVESNE